MSFFDRLKSGLQKTRESFGSALDNLLNGPAEIDDELFDELEETLVTADIGFESSMAIIDRLREEVRRDHIREKKEVRSRLIQIMKDMLVASDQEAFDGPSKFPMVILVIGVNGVGKTTTIAKMAHYYKEMGRSVLLVAADTFRAAAIDQLDLWAQRAGVDLVKSEEGADPASVVYDGIHKAQRQHVDLLICDTAGRLHNKKNLMAELEKIYHIIEREYTKAHLETLLVLDAGTGQNAVLQAKEFNKVTKITGLVLTKLDGTSKGGVLYPLQLECKVPVRFIGVGEGMDDLRPFDSQDFVQAIFGPKA